MIIYRRFFTSISVFSLVLLCADLSYGQQWSGILSPSRAINWSGAGVTGGIPARSTIYQSLGAPGGSSSTVQSVTAAQINAALMACPAGEVVYLNPGIYNLSGSVIMQGISNCTLRGSGADQTDLVFSGASTSCGTGAATAICVRGADANTRSNPSNSTSWTAGYAKGTTTISLSNSMLTGSMSNLKVGNYIILDQIDDTSFGCDVGGVLVSDIITACTSGSPTSPGINGPYSGQGNGGGQRSHRWQQQMVQVTQCDGSTTVGHGCSSGTNITISPGLYMPNWNWSPGNNLPQAWWATSPAQYDGIEDLTIDSTSNGGNANPCNGGLGVGFWNAANGWVKGVRSIDTTRAHIQINWSPRITARDNYFYLTQDYSTCSYGVEIFDSGDSLIENNIFQAVSSPYMLNGPGSGTVFGYNFSTLHFYNGGLNNPYNGHSHGDHAAGIAYSLIEGNYGSSVNADVVHGTHNFLTYFRNRYTGPSAACYNGDATDTSTSMRVLATGTFVTCRGNLQPISLDSFTRFCNLIGNVLGTTGVNTVYESQSNNDPVIRLGLGNSVFSPAVPNDPNVQFTAMIWGNCNSSNSFGTCPFNSNEVPSSLTGAQAPYSNPAPSSNALPASLYYTSKPSWWPSAKPWPPIGPDVTGGNISGLGGHAYTIPAQDCYMNVMGGPATGVGTVLTFSESACYSTSSATSPQPPTGLRAIVQ
jgi:hypothetical protein